MDRIYRPLDDFSNSQIDEIMQNGSIDDIRILPLSVGQNHRNWKYAQEVCVKLSKHTDPIVRANSILGFAYIARTKGELEKHVVKPIILKELRENEEFRWRIIDAIQDIKIFLNWDICKNAIRKYE